MLLQQRANNTALHALALAVNQAHLAKAGLLTLLEILFDDAGDILRLKWMEIEMILDGQNNDVVEGRIAVGHFSVLPATAAASIRLVARFFCDKNTAEKTATAAMPVAKLGMKASTVAAANSIHSMRFSFT